ncbi:MAG: ATP-binding protein [Phototrophicaceae bacterium]
MKPGQTRLPALINRARRFLARLLLGQQTLHPDNTSQQPAPDDPLTSDTSEHYKLLTQLYSDYVLLHPVAPDGTLGVEWVIGDSFEALTGYKPGEISYWDSVHPDDIDTVRRDIQRTLANQKTTSESRLKVKDGGYIWISSSRQPIWDEAEGRVVRYYNIVKDITERKQIEEALRDSEARHLALLNAIPDIMFRNHRDGTYLDHHAANPHDLLVPPEHFMGKTISDVLPPHLATQFMQSFEQALETGREVIFEYELPINDTIRYFEARVVACGSDELMTIVRDITEREQVERQKFELALEKERMRLLTEFIQGAAHEFRTPLSVINSGAYLMARANDYDKRMKKAQQIEHYVNRITELVDTMLTITRLEITNPLTYAPVDLNMLFKVTCQTIRLKYGSTPEIRCEYPDQLPRVMGDAYYLSMALGHLLSNACLYTPADGIITASSSLAGDHISIEICNTGPGIPPDVIDNVFNLFWRNDESHATPGFGLGLPITRRIIELHNGSICVTSQPGQQTCVHITLPTVPAEDAEPRDDQPT